MYNFITIKQKEPHKVQNSLSRRFSHAQQRKNQQTKISLKSPISVVCTQETPPGHCARAAAGGGGGE
jgi:hypothetical protein